MDMLQGTTHPISNLWRALGTQAQARAKTGGPLILGLASPFWLVTAVPPHWIMDYRLSGWTWPSNGPSNVPMDLAAALDNSSL